MALLDFLPVETFRQIDRLSKVIKADVMWVLNSVETEPHTWASAWVARAELLETCSNWDTREMWWLSEGIARSRRRGKAWLALAYSAAFTPAAPAHLKAQLPSKGAADAAWAAATDGMGDVLAALTAYGADASACLRSPVEAVRFLAANGDACAALMYPAVFVKGVTDGRA